VSQTANPQEVTRLLRAIDGGDEGAADRLLPLVYHELRQLARSRMARERPGATLQPTGLVHEAYLRLVGDGTARFASRAHFFGAAAEAMRRILIERARSRSRLKRGGDQRPESLTVDPESGLPGPDELLALDQSLARLEALDPRMAQVVKLRCFVGMSIRETADAMGEDVSPRTVNRLWTAARAWLLSEHGRGSRSVE